ncbi:MAG: CMP/dCMP deaminase zinc-binding protein [Candidatus Magasanikbacteria bacterium GW2011_GWE2_42_7]|uniref:CMP/dCMP deaminase zinc-binding protein n=1 Tax=Candidatus Magasanikbacteria bacterium GW2011_GWE2_42_7 TaxID=1619052 RepID=A0A0G1BHC9_9BACT|nr:MAG: CMP/dCMP deaminase zinc-binding protein [Candidatus Magasanikbacteria bacterium GW2011_GWE2_42_7]
MTTHTRPDWDEYFMEIAKVVALRATCDRGRSGCVIVRNKQILVTGYVGSASGLPHCDEIGHQMKTMRHEDGTETQHCVRTAQLYCKMTPCRVCAKIIINAGIKHVVCEKRYHAGEESEEMFRMTGITLSFVDETIEQYANQ